MKGNGTHVHDATLDLCDDSVVAGRELDGGHLGDSDGDGLSLGGHENDLLVELNVGFCEREGSFRGRSTHEGERRTVAKETGDHELGSVADGVDGTVLDNDTLVASKEDLERSNDSTKVRF